jgi:hypothetical protein
MISNKTNFAKITNSKLSVNITSNGFQPPVDPTHSPTCM